MKVAADMHIHVFDGVTEGDLRIFFEHTFGSKYFNLLGHQDFKEWSKVCEKISDTPNIWVGSVSWLKAGLFDNSDKYVPSIVDAISEIIGEDLPMIDDVMIEKIGKTFDLPNVTSYKTADKEEIVTFLKNHKGYKAFTVSW